MASTKLTVSFDKDELVAACIKKIVEDGTLVEVVRCEYCKHWNESDCHSTVVPIVRKCMCMNVYTDPDFFCKYGERRNDAPD